MLFELCANNPPFEANTQALLGEKVRRGIYKSIPAHYSTAMSDLISYVHDNRVDVSMITHNDSSMLQQDSKIRPSIDTMLSQVTIMLA